MLFALQISGSCTATFCLGPSVTRSVGLVCSWSAISGRKTAAQFFRVAEELQGSFLFRSLQSIHLDPMVGLLPRLGVTRLMSP